LDDEIEEFDLGEVGGLALEEFGDLEAESAVGDDEGEDLAELGVG
jgi:hypothetical protein